MEIRVYNPSLDFLGLIENQRYVTWRRRYGRAGSFESRIPITSYNLKMLSRGNIVWMRGKDEAGVIEDLRMRHAADMNEITVRGRFLESYMDRRLIRPRLNFSGTVENAMRRILSDAVPLPLVQLEPVQGLTDTVTFQATYKNVLTYMEKLARVAGYGFRFKPDFSAKTITFEIFRGLDRSIHQSDRSRVIFSEAYGNINEVTLESNDQLYKNVAYVGGEGEGTARRFVVVGDDSSTGLERREVYVNASDIRQDDLTSDVYDDKLRQRGYDILNESTVAEYLEFIAEVNGNFRYKEHYDLGDIVTIKKESWDVSRDARISEVTEIYEHAEPQVLLTLGDSLPEKIDWEDR